MRKIFLLIVGCVLIHMPNHLRAQSEGAFRHLDLSLNAGTTGVGFELASPISDAFRLRAGFDIMPRLQKNLHFEVSSFDDNGNVISSQFSNLSARLKELTGYEVKDYVDMEAKPTFSNFKLLVDFFPFKKNKFWKNFYVTAGFYWGTSELGKAINSIEGAQTLVGMEMYNHLYEKSSSDEPLITVNGIGPDGKEVPVDVYLHPWLVNRIKATGRLAVGIGKYKNDVLDENGKVIHQAGSTYMMEPMSDGTVRARATVNSFKPYLGFGYGGRLIKNNDTYKISVDCGVLFWGGKPAVITHDGIDLSRDVDNIVGKVGDYVDIIGKFPVYPVLNIRLTRKLF
ncbi:MAG: hypothetical protein K6F22_06135 [Prevotella sp.]|nr:hypothetical protein [Prevotella sp.]